MKHSRRLNVTPVADPKAIVKFGNARFTILKDRLIRFEYSDDREFIDAPTQHFWFRLQPVPSYTVKVTGEIIEIKTKKLHLTYLDTEDGFTPETLSITLRESGVTWKFGDVDSENLFGTARTLDNCNGDFDVLHLHKLRLSEGLLSRSGWSVIDDSRSLVFDKKGFLSPWRNKNQDFYFFGYGDAYKDCLIDYYAVSGNVRMIPRWSLGIWWSRWQKYTQYDLERIAGEFETYGVPLSVCVVDMDWHLPGWTGYTWNPKFFPDPKGFFERIHAKGIHACLNLHPAKGVGPHEKMYPQMARHMGINPATRRVIPFDLSDPNFIEGYFKHLHHPLEKVGADFWWIDWQQGTESKISGLDPLWYLNHLHSNDLARTGKKRPINFSRWGSSGSHRYPIGFSGDTISTWKSLKFQLYFTANASNIGYGWWSNDIGGFAQHWNDEELYQRWVQFGCFSPIFRFHSSGMHSVDNRPWTKSEICMKNAIETLKLRRALLPYLYTYAWKNRCGGLPLLRPMYHEHPRDENAYVCPNQYYFGDDLIAAPFDEMADPDTGMTRKAVWFPKIKGAWYNFFNGKMYEDGKWHNIHGTVRDIPVYAKAGAVIPLKHEEGILDLIAFNGEGSCDIYEDDGETLEYKKGVFSVTVCKNKWQKNKVNFSIAQKKGELKQKFTVNLVLRGIDGNHITGVKVNGKSGYKTGRSGLEDFRIEGIAYTGKPVKIIVTLKEKIKPICRFSLFDFEKVIRNFNMQDSGAKEILANPKRYYGDYKKLARTAAGFKPNQLKALFELMSDVGFYHETLYDGREAVVWWNHNKLPGFEVTLSLGVGRHERSDAVSPLLISKEEAQRGWSAFVNYFGATTTEVDKYYFKR